MRLKAGRETGRRAVRPPCIFLSGSSRLFRAPAGKEPPHGSSSLRPGEGGSGPGSRISPPAPSRNQAASRNPLPGR